MFLTVALRLIGTDSFQSEDINSISVAITVAVFAISIFSFMKAFKKIYSFLKAVVLKEMN
jgi:hypothetical protein